MTSLWLIGSSAWAQAADEPAPDEPTPEQVRFFETQVRPLLADRCYKCHGQDKQKGSLRLDSRSAMLAGGETGPAIAPPDVDGSLLMEAVRYESFEMPPDGKLSDDQVAVLARWVKMGAPWPGDQGPAAPPRAKSAISDEDRAFWSFQPLVRQEPPQVPDVEWSGNAIDRFVFERLRLAGLTPAERADRRTLIRRVTFDLLGVPPTPDEVQQFLGDESPQAFASLVDRLLERPEYGQRWARHWLDLVRYAESDGFRQDAYRPHAWRYRDYVIQSFNDDKPYDQFVLEQLAGDELWPGNPDAMVATALLRHGIYEYNQRDVRTQWQDMLNDITDVTADVFLGLGMGCARCHDHKFDPILQEDYFRLQAFFTPLLPRDDLPLAPPDQVARHDEALRHWEQQTADIRQEIAALEAGVRQQAAEAAINKFPLDIRPMLRKEPEQRAPFEHQLAELANRQVVLEYEKLDFAAKLKDDAKARWEELQKQLAALEHLKPKPLPAAFTVTDVGPQPPPTLIPGKRDERDILPGFLSVLDPRPAEIPTDLPNSQTTGRRTALARWLTRPDNPLTPRVIVNRLWQQHFGQGLVATASDFGRLGQPPSHPELLDWLATEFVEQGWSLKQLHRLIVNTATYQQTSLRPAPEVARLHDPDNRLLWRMPVHRLDAEQIRDAMLSVSGELDSKAGGESVDAGVPRRGIYTKVFRNTRDPLLAAFDATDGFSSLPQRNVTTTPTQSLLMINGQWSLQRAAAMARRVASDGAAPEEQVRQAFWLAYGRPPSPQERDEAVAFLRRQGELASHNGPATATIAGRGGEALDLSPGHPRQLLRTKRGLPHAESPFTIEAVVVLRSMYPDAAVRTIVAQWDGNQTHPGWSLGVTSAKSAYKPRNLILQLVGKNGQDKTVYEVVPSNLHLELNTPYYVAATVRPDDTTASGITFYLQSLKGEAPLQTQSAAHQVVAPGNPQVLLTVGGRYGLSQHQWDGLIDDLRLSEGALPVESLAIQGGLPVAATLGAWTFDDANDRLADGGPGGNSLLLPGSLSGEQALIDLCHALLNSNEFLYVD
jgi:hypothetical protein